MRIVVPGFDFGQARTALGTGSDPGLMRPILSTDGKTLLLGDAFADLAKGKSCRQRYRDGMGATLSPDEKTVASQNSGEVRPYDVASNEKIAILVPNGLGSSIGGYIAPAFTPDSRKVLVLSKMRSALATSPTS